MKLKSLFILLATTLTFAASVHAETSEYCFHPVNTNIGPGAGNVFTHDFNLGSIESIDYVSIELNHSRADNIDFTLENTVFGSTFIFSTDNGAFSNLSGTYTFVSVLDPVNGGNGLWDGDAGDNGLINPGFYDAETWLGGPWDAGISDWQLVLDDDGNGDGGSVGKVTIGFTRAVPEPAAVAILGLVGCGLLSRRRKQVTTAA